MNKRLRTMTVFFALVSVIFMIITIWIPVDLNEWNFAVELVAGVLIALGVLVDTGAEPQPLSKESILEKLQSPLAVNSIFALIMFFVYKFTTAEVTNTIAQAIATLLFVVFGVAVENNPNARKTFQ